MIVLLLISLLFPNTVVSTIPFNTLLLPLANVSVELVIWFNVPFVDVLTATFNWFDAPLTILFEDKYAVLSCPEIILFKPRVSEWLFPVIKEPFVSPNNTPKAFISPWTVWLHPETVVCWLWVIVCSLPITSLLYTFVKVFCLPWIRLLLPSTILFDKPPIIIFDEFTIWFVSPPVILNLPFHSLWPLPTFKVPYVLLLISWLTPIIPE